MKFKVQFVISISGKRQIGMECEYIAPYLLPSIAEMMSRCAETLRMELEKQEPFFQNCDITISSFKQINDDDNEKEIEL